MGQQPKTNTNVEDLTCFWSLSCMTININLLIQNFTLIFFLSSFSFFFQPTLLLFSLLSGIASWFTDLVKKYVTHAWRFWVLTSFFYKMQPNFMIHDWIFLWIWVTHPTQIVSPESSWYNNHHFAHFWKTKQFHILIIFKLKKHFFTQKSFQWTKSSFSDIANR